MYEIRQCEDCGLRYPLTADHPFGEACPNCRGATRLILRRELVTEPVQSTSAPLPNGTGIKVEALLDNIRSAWNVGSMFRTADGLGIARLHLCGITPTPEFDGVRKTALGAQQSVPWTYHRDALAAARQLKSGGKQLWALEQDARARSIAQLPESNPNAQVVILVGNEITGIDADLLDMCDQIFHIPMQGAKRSFNVAVAFGIAAYRLLAADGARR
jgi:23S rRNA (guanosine2251-2'-O)-methyltransferase